MTEGTIMIRQGKGLTPSRGMTIIWCPKCQTQVLAKQIAEVIIRKDGKRRWSEYECPAGHIIKRERGKWRANKPVKAGDENAN